ncbi:MAG TPA: aspartate/glutamate racemase family protein [Candidatus Limnocylindrales bacterium]
MQTLAGGRTVYGYELGVLMLDTIFPRPVGDVGNAATWPFPVRFRVVPGATSGYVVKRPDSALRDQFVDAARELEQEGVPMITTSCGFLAQFQPQLAAAVSVPVLSSSLLQVPLVARMIGPDRSVGILTMSEPHLTEAQFEGVGFRSSDLRIVVGGMAPESTFAQTYLEGRAEADGEVLEAELVSLAARVVDRSPDVGAFVLECTNFPPYAPAIRRALGRPVFDLTTLVIATHEAVVGTAFGTPA